MKYIWPKIMVAAWSTVAFVVILHREYAYFFAASGLAAIWALVDALYEQKEEKGDFRDDRP